MILMADYLVVVLCDIWRNCGFRALKIYFGVRGTKMLVSKQTHSFAQLRNMVATANDFPLTQTSRRYGYWYCETFMVIQISQPGKLSQKLFQAFVISFPDLVKPDMQCIYAT